MLCGGFTTESKAYFDVKGSFQVSIQYLCSVFSYSNSMNLVGTELGSGCFNINLNRVLSCYLFPYSNIIIIVIISLPSLFALIKYFSQRYIVSNVSPSLHPPPLHPSLVYNLPFPFLKGTLFFASANIDDPLSCFISIDLLVFC